jgi:hypothetical protein
MGASYTSHHVRATDAARVTAALGEIITEPALVSDASGGWVSVFCEETESQAEGPIRRIGEDLSRTLGTSVLAFLVHDSDIFCYWLYDRGGLRDEYNSCPDYFDGMMEDPDEQRDAEETAEYRRRCQGSPEAVLPLRPPGTTSDALAAILHPPKRYLFAEEQVTDLGTLLRLSDDGRTGVGFKYISQGDAGFPHTRISPATLSQDYLDRKLWGIEGIRRPDVLRQWLAQGADPNARDASGETILFNRSAYCMTGDMQPLIEAGADVNSRTEGRHEYGWERGVTPLMAAATTWQLTPSGKDAVVWQDTAVYEEAIRLLIDAGADVNARSDTGRTALKAAAGMPHPSLTWQRRPLTPAQREQGERIAGLLRSAGAVE